MNRKSLADIFAGFADDDAIAAYIQLHSIGRVPDNQAAQFLGGSDIVQALRESGMARVVADTPGEPASLQAAPVVLALQALLTARQVRVLNDQKLLLKGQLSLADAQALSDELNRSDTTHDLVRIVIGRENIARVSACMINSAQRNWMTFETAATDQPVTVDHRNRLPESLREGVRVRSIYDMATLTNPEALINLQLSVADGEEARIAKYLPTKFQLADESCLLLPTSDTGTSGAIIVYAIPIIRAYHDYFELKWQQSLPFGGIEPTNGSPLTGHQQQILQLMLAGLPYEAIGRQVGKGEKTVRRYIEAMYEMTGTDCPFALGVAVATRGWITSLKGDHA